MNKILLYIILVFPIFSYDIVPIYSKDYKATLVESKIKTNKAIFYIHGFNDYIFNTEIIEKFNAKGFSFFGIDLHNYGRNINKNTKTPHYFNSVDEYFEEINAAISHIRHTYNIKDITLIAHSQGGLIASLFVDKYPNAVNRLVLNSPFFDFYFSRFIEDAIIPIVSKIGKYYPTTKLPIVSTNKYGQSISNKYFGEWNFDTNLKKIKPDTYIYFGWIRAIYLAQQKLQNGLNIKIPTLVLLSDKSHTSTDLDIEQDREIIFSSDIVLDVNDIKKYSKNIAKNITIQEIKNAIHDVFLSKKPIREKAFLTTIKWIEEYK